MEEKFNGEYTFFTPNSFNSNGKINCININLIKAMDGKFGFIMYCIFLLLL